MIQKFVIVVSLIISSETVIARNVDFEQDVAPILGRRCVECHQGTDPSGGLNLTNREAFRKGGDSGPVTSSTTPHESLMWERIVAGEMPPEKQGESQKLPEHEINLIKSWIDQKTPWPQDRRLDLYEFSSEVRGGRDWWSLQPIVRPGIPTPKNKSRIANPIDAFVMSRLEQANLQPAPIANKAVLIRRLYYDLLGLPPRFEQIEEFRNDDSPQAWPKLVTRILKSPHYGERWARHWLDVVRFAETSGYERDQEKPFAWRYRDWVVNALNNDMPFDRFVIHQLAGDEISDRTKDSVIATGFLRLGTWNDEPNDDRDYQYERLEDLVHATSSAFLGLTVKCARCHDHKFDPIPQNDYYKIAAAFWPGPIQARDRKFLGGPSKEELGFDDVLGWTDINIPPSKLFVLKNGDRHSPLSEALPGTLSAISYPSAETSNQPEGSAKTTGRRLRLARWLASKQNPLTARVIVNRIWQQHFGKGIVTSANNFGFRGSAPTHPQLLDWLASELIVQNWSLKHIHDLILNSHTWRQSSIHPNSSTHELVDSGNNLVWRQNRRRLDAESLRDAILTASGSMDLTMGGPSFLPTITPAAMEGLSRKASAWNASPKAQQTRRSLYMYTKRHLISPFMTAFDFCDTTLPCAQRNTTTVAPQALAMLNHDMPHEQSLVIAQQFKTTSDKQLAKTVRSIWRKILSRDPNSEEISMATRHIEKQSLIFESKAKRIAAEVVPNQESPDHSKLVLHLSANVGIEADAQSRVTRWLDQSGHDHHAVQSLRDHQPIFKKTKPPTLEFQGGHFFEIGNDLMTGQEFTLIAVASDVGESGHREIISNWNGSAGNSTTSVFLGLTGEAQVRFSDRFNPAGEIQHRHRKFVLSATNGANQAIVYQNTNRIASSSMLPSRNLSTPWVIGQQGNIDGEYWHGTISEIMVFDRALSELELKSIWSGLIDKHAIQAEASTKNPSTNPRVLAIASLCHVLLNSNEFIFVD